MLRTFIAIEMPAEVKSTLGRLQERLKRANADVKWVAPENIHLTLKFLGERDDKKIEQISEILDGTAQNHNSFYASISTLGGFPSLNSPRVMWVGINGGEQECKSIYQELEEKISKLGIPKEERPFSAHITIGRSRSASNRKELIECLNGSSDYLIKEALRFKVAHITLFKSTLNPQGPVYDPLKLANLKAT